MRIKFLAGVLFDRESRKSIPNETAPSTQESPKEVAATISAEELVEESDRYWRTLARTLALGGGIAAVGLLGISAIAALSRADAERSPDTAVTMVLERAPMGLTLAVFGVLATVAIALQVAVRGHAAAPTPGSSELARQQALTNVAALLVPAALGLGLYAAGHAFVGFETLDLVRTLGPLGIGLLIAIVAADAGTAVRPEFKSQEMQTFGRAREIENLQSAKAIAMVGESGVSRFALVSRAAVLVATPLFAAVGIWFFARPIQDIGGGVFALVVLYVQTVSYLMSILAYYAAVRRQWGLIGGVVIVGGIFDIMYILAVTVLASRIGARAESFMVVVLVAACLLILSFLPRLLVFISIVGFPGSDRGGVIPNLVGRYLSSQLDKLQGPAVARPQKCKFNVFAVAAMWSICFPPAAIVLGNISLVQLQKASARKPMTGEVRERGKGLAWSAILGSIALAIAVLLGVATLAFMDWNQVTGHAAI
ncbi:hypothetical protein [Leucobacter aridicollis]|uniref:hypothetical protein n=1 Tax=Leucobacter aridicollis TaxID=283878 RepID=UPI0011C461D7